MNKMITGLLVVAGIAISSTTHAQAQQLSTTELAGVCTATHVFWGLNAKAAGRNDLSQRSLAVVNQLDARYKNNSQYENMYNTAFKRFATEATSNNTQQLATALIRLSNNSCSVAGVPAITVN